jgi:hypothetical protein
MTITRTGSVLMAVEGVLIAPDGQTATAVHAATMVAAISRVNSDLVMPKGRMTRASV